MGTEPVRISRPMCWGKAFADLKEMMGTAADSPTRLEGDRAATDPSHRHHTFPLRGLPGSQASPVL
jgi:hypothetical protein